MKINRTEIEPGLWQYFGEDEAFVLCVQMLVSKHRDENDDEPLEIQVIRKRNEIVIERIDDFIEGRHHLTRKNGKGETVTEGKITLEPQVVDYLAAIRTGALSAFLAGDQGLMLAKLAWLDAECRYYGMAHHGVPLMLARHKRSVVNTKNRGHTGRARELEVKAILKRLASSVDADGSPTAISVLWPLFISELNGVERTDPVRHVSYRRAGLAAEYKFTSFKTTISALRNKQK